VRGKEERGEKRRGREAKGGEGREREGDPLLSCHTPPATKF